MCRMQRLLAVIVLTINVVYSWDFAVTNGDQLEFYTNGTKTTEGMRFSELTALAYDAVHNMLLFVDRFDNNASIFSYQIDTKKYQPLVEKKFLDENIQGLAFDPVTSTLFWTHVKERSIFWKSLTPGSKNNVYGNLLIKMNDEIPRAIAVDSCRGYIYWSNTNVSNPTIERAKFDGTDRKILIDKSKKLYMPVSITIDQHSRRFYWTDDKEGIHYSIESSDLDGNDVRVELEGTYHQPNSLTVSKKSLYWIDWTYKTLWRLPKNANGKQEPENMLGFKDTTPFGIVANYNVEDQTRGIPECRNLAKLNQNKSAVNETILSIPRKEGYYCLHGEPMNGKLSCECSPGYFGERCETSICQNYCLQGNCSLTGEGRPSCRCKSGFSGARCEIDLCLNYCLNDAVCSVDPVNNTPLCKCDDHHQGLRCESKKIDNNIQRSNDVLLRFNETKEPDVVSDSCDAWDPIRDPIMMTLGILCGVLCVACAVLFTKVLHLKKRPRIRKRIIVNKNVTPLTARPDQCEITIENCCNMNICETPCFEPRSTIRPTLLDAKPGKEEKHNLIANMEQPDDF